MPNSSRVSMWILRRTPDVVMSAPERIFLKFAVMLLGIGLLLNINNPQSITSQLPTLGAVNFALLLILSGATALWGIVGKHRALERVGLAGTALGAAVYALLLVSARGSGAAPAACIFFGLALASLARLVISSAAARVIDDIAKDSEP